MQQLDLQTGGKHCVFQCGEGWYALPALGVREIVVRPTIVPVPHCPPVSAGICHIRNEFLPILNFEALLVSEGKAEAEGEQMLVLSGPEGPWAALIGRVAGLEALEISLSGESRVSDDSSPPIVGTATYGQSVVRVVDPDSLYRRSVHLLESYWNDGPRRPV